MLRRFAQLTMVVGILYLGVAGWAAPWNPMQLLVRPSYIISGLVAVTIVANIASGLVFLRVEELMGARREVDLVKVSIVASVFLVAVAFTAGSIGAFALPLGVLVLSGARFVGYRHYRTKVYQTG